MNAKFPSLNAYGGKTNNTKEVNKTGLLNLRGFSLQVFFPYLNQHKFISVYRQKKVFDKKERKSQLS